MKMKSVGTQMGHESANIAQEIGFPCIVFVLIEIISDYLVGNLAYL